MIDLLNNFLQSSNVFPLTLSLRGQLSQCADLTAHHYELLAQKLNSPEYLECLIVGAHRLNLDGSIGDGVVTLADEKAAQEKLAGILRLTAVLHKSKTTYKITNIENIRNFNSIGRKVVNVAIEANSQRRNITINPKRLRITQQAISKFTSKNKNLLCYIRVDDMNRTGVNVPIFCVAQ